MFFGLFKKKDKKKEITFDYSSIVVDMHSHVLPGIDDGAQTAEESIELVKKMMALGIKKIIATPHIMADYYKNTPETINGALRKLKAELEKQQIDIEIEAAAEHYFDEYFESLVNNDKLMTMGDNYVLFEFSFISQPQNAIPIIQKLKDKGYKPILAHPERYGYMELEQFRTLHSWGVLFQLNTISLTGYYGSNTKKMAETLIDNDLIDFISSDMHHLRHAEALRNSLRTSYVEKLLFDYPLKNIMLKDKSPEPRTKSQELRTKNQELRVESQEKEEGNPASIIENQEPLDKSKLDTAQNASVVERVSNEKAIKKAQAKKPATTKRNPSAAKGIKK